jgi:hypothetical protein
VCEILSLVSVLFSAIVGVATEYPFWDEIKDPFSGNG